MIVFGQLYIQEVSNPKAELKLPSIPGSPIIDPRLSPDGTMIAYVQDCELFVLNLLSNESKQLTYGAKENSLVSLHFRGLYCIRVTKCLMGSTK